jgi:hypothetical protein
MNWEINKDGEHYAKGTHCQWLVDLPDDLNPEDTTPYMIFSKPHGSTDLWSAASAYGFETAEEGKARAEELDALGRYH